MGNGLVISVLATGIRNRYVEFKLYLLISSLFSLLLLLTLLFNLFNPF